MIICGLSASGSHGGILSNVFFYMKRVITGYVGYTDVFV